MSISMERPNHAQAVRAQWKQQADGSLMVPASSPATRQVTGDEATAVADEEEASIVENSGADTVISPRAAAADTPAGDDAGDAGDALSAHASSAACAQSPQSKMCALSAEM